jgi:hypothetical protein
MPRPMTFRSGGRCWRRARLLAAVIALGLLQPLAAQTVAQGVAQSVAQSAVPSRGKLLYDNHCVACHTTQMHWREQRVAVDLPSLRVQVLRWQATQQLGWSDQDVDEVVRHLNDSIYRFAPPTRIGVAPAPVQPIVRLTVASRSSGP